MLEGNKTHKLVLDNTKLSAHVRLSDDDYIQPLFQSEAGRRNRDKSYREGPIEIDLGVMSNDRVFLQFKDDLSVAATKLLPESVDPESGRTYGNGVSSNFLSIRHVSGYPARPATFPLMDNTYLRTSKGLCNEFTQDWHRLVFRAIIECFFSDLEVAKVPIKKDSSSMIPFYTKDLQAKIGMVIHGYQTWDNTRNLVLKSADFRERGDIRAYKAANFELFRDHGLFGAYHTVYRQQASDAINYEKGEYIFKPRPVADLLYAITGGREGTFAPGDKSIGDAFWAPTGFSRARNRTAMGGPLGTNGLLFPIAHAVRKKIYSRYAYSFHHTTRLSLQEDLRKWGEVIAADVSNHDWFWPTFFVEEAADVLSEMGFDPAWVEVYRRKTFLANYVTDVGPDEGNVLIGDWLNPTSRGGLPSGNAFTDLEGTYGMTFVYLIMMIEHTYPEAKNRIRDQSTAIKFVDDFLRGLLPIKLKDKSDDALLGWDTNPALQGRVSRLRTAMKNGDPVSDYMVVSYEHGGAFLGSTLLYDKSFNSSSLTLIGDVSSFLRNRFSPEYGVQSQLRDRSKAKRPYWGLAWGSRQEAYGSAPAFGELSELVEFYWRKHFDESYTLRQERLYDEHLLAVRRAAALNQAHSGLSNIDLEVLVDPSKLSYKYTESDVSPQIYDLLFKGVNEWDVEPFFNQIVPK